MPPTTPPMMAPVGLTDGNKEDMDDTGEADGALITTITVGEDIVTPGYDACNAVVS